MRDIVKYFQVLVTLCINSMFFFCDATFCVLWPPMAQHKTERYGTLHKVYFQGSTASGIVDLILNVIIIYNTTMSMATWSREQITSLIVLPITSNSFSGRSSMKSLKCLKWYREMAVKIKCVWMNTYILKELLVHHLVLSSSLLAQSRSSP